MARTTQENIGRTASGAIRKPRRRRKGRPRKPARPAAPRPARRFTLSSRRLARRLAQGRRDGAGTRRARRPDAARGGARGRRVACRADPSFRRSHRPRQRTRRDRLPPIQCRDGGGRRHRCAAADEGDGPCQGLCRLCAGASRHVRADVPHRAARHEAAVAARGRQRLVRRDWPARSASAVRSRYPTKRCRWSRLPPSRAPGRWCMVLRCCCSTAGSTDILRRLPKGNNVETLLDAMLRSTVARPPAP